MPAEVIATERYAVYSTDGSNDDNKSICSERNSCLFRDPYNSDLIDLKNLNGKVTSCSPALSTTTIDRWGSYWSRRERCCCFWNFLLTVSLIVTVTVVILATKGFVFSSDEETVSDKTNDRGLPGYIAPINVKCTKETPPVKTCNDDICMRSRLDLLSRINTSVDPCQDFYSYACGGYMDKVRLSWNSPRKRMNPDIILETHDKMLLDILSDEAQRSDADEVKIIKKIYRSCVQLKQVIDSLGGFEFGSFKRTKQLILTSLLLEVNFKYGISPLFEMNVKKDGRILILADSSSPSELLYRDRRPDSILYYQNIFEPLTE
ncbi:neprilysin-21-like [Ruditapes philippinarum]|uniref:neprilysin-21-like n=1 Tax=Ruditapes philippinarum TaxID=129788 RepID=UPI00295B9561|nr:neprilysin-21-like [Ruditapes philippinarum]